MLRNYLKRNHVTTGELSIALCYKKLFTDYLISVKE